MLASILTNDYLPLDDLGWYSLMIAADVVILRFWWYVMSHLGDR